MLAPRTRGSADPAGHRERGACLPPLLLLLPTAAVVTAAVIATIATATIATATIATGRRLRGWLR